MESDALQHMKCHRGQWGGIFPAAVLLHPDPQKPTAPGLSHIPRSHPRGQSWHLTSERLPEGESLTKWAYKKRQNKIQTVHKYWNPIFTYLKCFLPHSAYMPLVKGDDKQAAISSGVDHLNIFRSLKGELTYVFHDGVLKINKLLIRRCCNHSRFQPTVHLFSRERQDAQCDADVGMRQNHRAVKRVPIPNKIAQGLAGGLVIRALFWKVLQSKNKYLVFVEGEFSNNSVGQLNGYLSHLSCLQWCIEDITSMAPQHCGALEDGHTLPHLIREFKLNAGLQSVWAAQCEESVLEALSFLTLLCHQDTRRGDSPLNTSGTFTFHNIHARWSFPADDSRSISSLQERAVFSFKRKAAEY